MVNIRIEVNFHDEKQEQELGVTVDIYAKNDVLAKVTAKNMIDALTLHV